MSPTISSAACVGHRLHQRLHQQHIDHGGFVDDQQIAVQRIVLVALESAALADRLPAADGWSWPHAGRLGHPLGGAAGRRAEQQLHVLGGQDAQDRVDDGRLADAGPAGDDQHLGQQRQLDRRFLAVGEREAGLLLDPGRAPCRHRSAARAARRSAMRSRRSAMACSARYRPARKMHGVSPTASATTAPFRQFEIQGGLDQFRRRLEQTRRRAGQIPPRQPAVSVVHGLGERIGDPGPQPDHGRLLDAEPHGDRIRRLEADAPDVASRR